MKDINVPSFGSPPQETVHDEMNEQTTYVHARVLEQLDQDSNEFHLSHEREEFEDPCLSCRSPLTLSRTDSLRSMSSFRSDSSMNASECSVSGMKQKIHKVSKGLAMAGCESMHLNIKALEEVEQGRSKEFQEEGRERERDVNELQNLANCVHGDVALKRNKLEKLSRRSGLASACSFLLKPLRIFQSKNDCPGHSFTEDVASVSKKDLFSGCFAPSVDDVSPQLGSPSQQKSRLIFQFTKVESTQRDFPAWTMEEYMTKNGRIQEWMHRKDDEEFGGIEGNNLMSQWLDDDVMNSDDTDSD